VSEDLTRDPLIDRLAQFTPTSKSIDRDAMLFAAGHASAPRARGWKLATALLALAQTATLGIWLAFPHPELPPQGSRITEVEHQPGPPQPPSPAVEPVAAASYANLVRRWERDGLPPPPVIADPLPSRPTLSVAASRRVLFVD
jgi:hypothetical protein